MVTPALQAGLGSLQGQTHCSPHSMQQSALAALAAEQHTLRAACTGQCSFSSRVRWNFTYNLHGQLQTGAAWDLGTGGLEEDLEAPNRQACRLLPCLC